MLIGHEILRQEFVTSFIFRLIYPHFWSPRSIQICDEYVQSVC